MNAAEERDALKYHIQKEHILKKLTYIKNKHNAELERIPTQQIWVNSVPGGVFSHIMPKIDFYHSHRLKKNFLK